MKGFIEVTEKYTYTTSHRDKYGMEEQTLHKENMPQIIAINIIKRVIPENKISEYAEIFFDETGINRIRVSETYEEIKQKIKQTQKEQKNEK